MTTVPDSSPRSAPALLSFGLLVIWMITIGGLFYLISARIDVPPLMAGILGGVFASESQALAALTGFWLANSMNSNRSSASKDAVIAQQAGATPPAGA